MQIDLETLVRTVESLQRQDRKIRDIQNAIKETSAFFHPSREYYAGIQKNLQQEFSELEQQSLVLMQMADTLQAVEHHVRMTERQVSEQYTGNGTFYVRPAIGAMCIDILSPCPWTLNLY